MHLVAALPREIEGDACDALDFARRIDRRINGALLAILKRDNLLGLTEVRAARQLAQNEDVQSLDQLALEARRFGERRVANRRTQVGEEIELLPQPEQARLGADLVGDLVPLRSADRAEDDGIGGLGLGEDFLGQRRAVLVDRAPAAERLLGPDLGLALLGEKRDETIDFGHDLGANAVAGKQEQIVCRHGEPPSVVRMREQMAVVLDRPGA